MKKFLAKRKNDQFRSGSVVCIARSKSLSCPVSLLKSLLVKAGSLGKHVPVFRSFRKGSSEKFCPSNQPWSYSFARARVLQDLADSAHMSFADFTDRYSLHSLRSGGATLVAKEGVPDHIFRLMEPGGLGLSARPCTRTLRGLLPINCFQPGPCTTKPRL